MLNLKADINHLKRLDEEKYKFCIRGERKVLKEYMTREAA
jgi:hypothetical protein